jgi:ABC-2 type transport system ATP-binding protein
VVDPGPPPPLPPDLVSADLVIPPKPPLPPRVEPAPDEPEPELVEVEPEPVEPEPELVEAEPELVEAEPESVEAEPEPAEAEAELIETVEAPEAPAPEEPEPEPEPLVELGVVIEPTVESVPDSETAALVVKGVSKSFGGTRAVDGIDLTVPAGTFYGLVGPNGAGKTTTLSLIAGLLRPDRGSIVVGGVDAASDPVGAKRQMGVLPDRLRTFDRLTGRQLLHYYGVLRGLPRAVVESRTADLARAFDLADALGRAVSDYSGGMVKKVMLAGALIHSPRLLVLDEPFEAVDPVSSAIILDILSTYVAHGGTVILSSHGMELVERHCSRVAVIVAGQVLVEGTVEEVRGELTLEQRFIELAGGLGDVEGLEWLHTFSG